jgi:hypothetical protein
MTRSQFDALPPRKRMDLILAGECVVVADPPRARVRMPVNAISRIEFDRLSAAERATAARTKEIVDTDGEGLLL